MSTDLIKIQKRRRRSVLIGLVLILLVSCGECIIEVFDYARLSISLNGIRHSPDYRSTAFSEERAINHLEESLERTRLALGMHVGLSCIAVWCLVDALRIDIGDKRQT